MSNKPNRKPSPSTRTTSTRSGARVAHASAASSSSTRLWWIIGVVVVVIGLALVVAIVAGRGTETTALGPIKGGGTVVPNGNLTYGDVKVDGAALPEQPAGSATDPAIGKKAPTITGEQFNGAPLTLPTPGKPAVVRFVAHWCPHCQKEVPVIAKYLTENGLPTDVDLYAVATSTTDQRENFPPAAWLNKEQWPVPTIADDKDNRAASAYGIGGFPYFVVLDANGNVVQRTSGELTVDQFKGLLDAPRATPAATPGSAAKVS